MSFELTIQDIPHYTYKDYELWEGDRKLIKGMPYSMSPAHSWMHQNIGNEFVTEFKLALRENNKVCNCNILYECNWIVNEDTIVRPDVMIVCEKIEGKYPTRPLY